MKIQKIQALCKATKLREWLVNVGESLRVKDGT